MSPRTKFNLVCVAIIGLVLVEKYYEHTTHPNPNPGPVPGGKLWVCMVEETSQRSQLPPAQLNALMSTDVRDYLNSHCDRENGTATWRLFDKDQDLTNESKEWQDEFNVLKKETPPAIAIGSDKMIRSKWAKPQPLPKDTDSLLKLLKKYGGA